MKKFRIILALDRSGSMSGVTGVTIQGVNEIIRSTRNIASVLKVPVNLTFIGFEDNRCIEFIKGYKDVSIDDIKQVTKTEIFGRGGTNMYDAMSFLFEKTEDIVSKDETVLVAVFSDGGTFGDATPPEDVTSAVKSSKGWTFAFVGANQDAEISATKMGFPKTNAMEYQSDVSGTRSAFFKLSRAIRYWMEYNTESKKPKTTEFFLDDDLKKSVMTVNGVKLTINMPEAILSKDEDNKLPPYSPIAAHIVDEYPACPANWEHGSAKASSYFVSAKDGHGMWFDFNGNADNEYDIAAVLSIQGVNPITGTPTNLPLKLEKYDAKCPIHDEEFKQDRFCDKCGFKWPSQNFISSSGSPNGQFWLDGFRTPDGKVRQYIFTEETAKGVANAIIGEDRVFAIGVAFYRSKNKKPVPEPMGYMGYTNLRSRGITASTLNKGFSGISGCAIKSHRTKGISGQSVNSCYAIPMQGKIPESSFESKTKGLYSQERLSMYDDNTPIGSSSVHEGATAAVFDSDYVIANALETNEGRSELDSLSVDKSYEVGAGAKIDQAIHTDTNSLDFWEEEPLGVIYVNYADENAVKRILSSGKRKEVVEGFLASVPVGK